jgi:hypothetical protein
VLDGELARGLEALPRRHRGRQRVDDPVVEADEREVRLGDGQVLVVAEVGDDRLALLGLRVARAARQVEAVHRRVAGGDGVARLQVLLVGLVELLRLGVERAGAVERVEVEAGRAALEQLRRRLVLAEHDGRLVERQVVVDELPEVGEAGRDPGRSAAARGHRVGELPAHSVGELHSDAARAHAREAERRAGLEARAVGASAHALVQQSLADYVVTLRAMVRHAASLVGVPVRGPSHRRGPPVNR